MSEANPPHQPPPKRRSWNRWLIAIGAIILGGVVFLTVGFMAGTTVEEHDSFCAVCHTVPETTYFDRSTAAIADTSSTVSDLATVHYRQAQAKNQSFSCIACHRGDSSLGERAQTLMLGARDTLIFVTGKADPTIEKSTIFQTALVNTACISCHKSTLLTVKGTQTHFHNFLPQTAVLVAQGNQLITSGGRARRLRTINTSLTCVSCHLAHKTVDTSNPQLMYVDKATAQQACDLCHQAAGERPQSIDRLLRGGED